MFDISIEDYCSFKLPKNEFINLIGNSNKICNSSMIKFPLKSRIIYKPINSSAEEYFVDVKIYVEENNDKCKNINVFVNTKINGYVRICEKVEYESFLCKYVCKLKQFEEITIFLLRYAQKLCDVQLRSKRNLINVCI